MSKELIPEQAEFHGVENYGAAVQSVLDNAGTIGFAVVRECFDADDITEYDYRAPNRHYMEHVVEDEAQHKLGFKAVDAFWRANGFTGEPTTHAFDSSRVTHHGRHGYTVDQRWSHADPIIKGIVSFSGRHTLYVRPGMLLTKPASRERSAELTAQDLSQLVSDRNFARRNIAGYRNEFASRADLRPSDVALLMGHPQPAYSSLQATTRRPAVIRTSASKEDSFWGSFSYGASR